MKFELTDVRIFLSAYDSGSLSQAAAQNNVVVAAVSARIKRLEEQFALSLFDRTGRGIRPTSAGDVFAKHARRILAESSDAEQDLAALLREQTGEVRLVTNTDMLAEHLPRALGIFLAHHDDVRITIQERPAPEAVALVRNGGAHLAIASEPADRSGLLAVPLAPDQLVLVAPRDTADILFGTGTVSFGEIMSHPLIGLRQDASLTRFLLRVGHDLGHPPTFRIHVDGIEAACRMVEAGAGIAVVPESAALRYAAFINYRIIPISDPRAGNMMYLCARSREQLPPVARELFEHLSAYGEVMRAEDRAHRAITARASGQASGPQAAGQPPASIAVQGKPPG